MISTRAGALGINLTGANRAILFDASWNPFLDVSTNVSFFEFLLTEEYIPSDLKTQSVYRIYRLGQEKACFIYRFISNGTMEEQTYKRQVNKLNLSTRVVDAKETDRHYEEHDLSQLYNFDNIEPAIDKIDPSIIDQVEDELLMTVLKSPNNMIYKYHCHDSLLQDINDELTQDEKDSAWYEFELDKQLEKKAQEVLMSRINDNESEDMDIYGFSTSELLKLLTIKAQNDFGREDVKADLPRLLTRLHNEMAEGIHEVMIHVFI